MASKSYDVYLGKQHYSAYLGDDHFMVEPRQRVYGVLDYTYDKDAEEFIIDVKLTEDGKRWAEKGDLYIVAQTAETTSTYYYNGRRIYRGNENRLRKVYRSGYARKDKNKKFFTSEYTNISELIDTDTTQIRYPIRNICLGQKLSNLVSLVEDPDRENWTTFFIDIRFYLRNKPQGRFLKTICPIYRITEKDYTWNL